MVEIALFLSLRWWIRIFIGFIIIVASLLQAKFDVGAVNFLWRSNLMYLLVGMFIVTFLFPSGDKRRGR